MWLHVLVVIHKQTKEIIITNLEVAPDDVLGYMTMKKYFAIALIALVGAGAIYVNAKTTNAEVAPGNFGVNVHVTGNDDGHCHYCGPKKCPYFRAKSGADPTICKCGHSKRSHVDSY